MSSYLKIGEFSKLMQTTVKTLRLYEQRGLLLPAHIDPDSGYRYYTVAQMQRLNSVRSLKRLGFSLEEIRDLFADDSQVPPLEALSAKIRATETQLAELIERRSLLTAWLNSRRNLLKWTKS